MIQSHTLLLTLRISIKQNQIITEKITTFLHLISNHY
jgi:hypothetical protein